MRANREGIPKDGKDITGRTNMSIVVWNESEEDKLVLLS